MGKLKFPETYSKWLHKYKFAILILLAGAVLMVWPTGAEEKETVITQAQDNIITTEEKLENILHSIAGAGKVRVMLSLKTGEEVVYQTDDQYSSEGVVDSSDTVTVTDENRAEIGLVSKVLPPTYLGAVIVCQGADSPNVRLAIVEAVSKVTGLGSDRIAVLKMN